MSNIREVRAFILTNYFHDPIGAHEGLAEAWKIAVEQDCEVRLEIGYRSGASGPVIMIITKIDKIEALHSRLEDAMKHIAKPGKGVDDAAIELLMRDNVLG